MFVDTHLHLNDEQYQDDLDEVIARAREAGVGFMLCVGWDIPSSIKAVEIANKYSEVYAAIGVHPENLEGVTLEDLNKLRELAKEPKVIAIGEIGFDFHWYKKEEAYENQKKFFEAQVKMANELNLPIIYGMKTPEENITVGNRISQEDLVSLETILKIMNAMNDSGLSEKVTSIDISDKNDYSIYMQEERKTIHLGDGSNLSNKMLYVVAILEKEKDVAGEIFANGDLNSDFKVYFREEV